MVKYIFRMDDICPQMNWENFRRYEKLFDKYDIKPLIGIIPNNKDKNISFSNKVNEKQFWKEMQKLKKKSWSIAQHGFEHISYKKLGGGILNISNKSEFAKIDFKIQFDKLEKGLKIMKKNNLQTDIFMAPSHSFDENTLKTLEKLKFKFITDGFELYPIKKNNLIFVPQLLSFPIKIPFGVQTICIHSNKINKKSFKKLEKFLSKNKNNCIKFEDSVKYISKSSLNIYLGKILKFILNKIR